MLLKRHLYFSHNIGHIEHLGKLHKCAYCGKISKGPSDIRRHSIRCKKIKEAKTTYECTYCIKKYLNNSSLNRHLKICKQNPSGNGQGNSEMKQVDTPIKRNITVISDLCSPQKDTTSNVTASASNFTMPTCTSASAAAVAGLVTSVAVVYQCGSCNDTFATEEHLKQHARHHADERYPCPHCSQKFTYNVRWHLDLR